MIRTAWCKDKSTAGRFYGKYSPDRDQPGFTGWSHWFLFHGRSECMQLLSHVARLGGAGTIAAPGHTCNAGKRSGHARLHDVSQRGDVLVAGAAERYGRGREDRPSLAIRDQLP